MDFERFFLLMSDYLDRDLDLEAWNEFHRELEEEFHREFFNTFRRTVQLCHDLERDAVPLLLHIELIETIRRTPQIERAARKPRKKKRGRN